MGNFCGCGLLLISSLDSMVAGFGVIPASRGHGLQMPQNSPFCPIVEFGIGGSEFGLLLLELGSSTSFPDERSG